MVARRTHIPEVAGSSPAPATKLNKRGLLAVEGIDYNVVGGMGVVIALIYLLITLGLRQK